MDTDAGLVAIGLFLVTQLVAWAWWASRITSAVKDIRDDIRDIKNETSSSHVKFIDLDKRLVVVEARCEHFHQLTPKYKTEASQ